MNENNTILIIGGDSRQLYMSDYLESQGFETMIYGLPEIRRACVKDLRSAASESRIVVLPLPVTKNEKSVYSVSVLKESLEDIISAVGVGKIVFGGMISRSTEAKLKKNSNKVYDYFKREDVTAMNAVPTVQGIIKIITENIDYTVHSSRISVFGYGRIGKLAAQVLSSLGADVTVCVRKSGDLAAARVGGYSSCAINEFEKIADRFDIIVNTVPAQVINKSVLSKLRPDCLIIDVASAPFGTDFAAAYELGIKALQCPSLPGKVAPKTAGEIIAKGIINTLREEELLND